MNIARDLTKGSIPGHFRALAIPSAIGMVFTTLYNVVDVFYAGLISTDAQAGLAIAFQVFFLLITIGFGLGQGLSALVGNALGSHDEPMARRTAAQGIGFGVFSSLLLMIVGYQFAPDLLALISEPGEYRDAATRYLDILILGTCAFVLAFGTNGILTATGDTVSMQRAQIAAFFANLALNPLCIFGIPGVIPGMGFDGIAVSTLISQTGVLIYILYRVTRCGVLPGLHLSELIPDMRSYRELAAQGLPASFTMLVMMLSGFVVQSFLKDIGGDAVAAYGVALRIEQLLLLPAFGLTGALLPIAAQNFGAGHHDRVREAAWFCFRTGVLLMLGASLVLWLAARPAMSIFSADTSVIEIGASYLNVDGFLLPVYVLLFGINALLQALKRPIWTLWISIYRQGIAVFVFVYIFVDLLDAGVWGVWFGIAAAVISGFVVSGIVASRVARTQIGGLSHRHPAGVRG